MRRTFISGSMATDAPPWRDLSHEARVEHCFEEVIMNMLLRINLGKISVPHTMTVEVKQERWDLEVRLHVDYEEVPVEPTAGLH